MYEVTLKWGHLIGIGRAVLFGIIAFISGMIAYDSILNLLELVGKGVGWFLIIGGLYGMAFLGDHYIAARKRAASDWVR